MPTFNVDEFEWKVIVRPLKIEDFDELIAMQQICFPGIPAWSREQIESQLSIFPEGQLCVLVDGKVVGSALSIIIDYNKFSGKHTYEQITGNYEFDTHNEDGDMLYGIDVFIHPEYRGLKNTFLLPHIGSATRETRDAMGFRALDNLDAIIAGREPRDRVA